jgi:two-component system NtrC family sensor kinase
MPPPDSSSLSPTQLNAILQTVGDGVITLDQDQLIVFLNREACELFGYEPGELLGQHCHLLMQPSDYAAHDHGFQRYIAEGAPDQLRRHARVQGLRKDGTTFPLDLRFTATRVGDSLYFNAAARDISVQLDYERRLTEANQTLEARVAERTAELARQHGQLVQAEKMAALGQLIAGVAHEINTPLGAIKSNNDTSRRTLDRLQALLEKDTLSEEERAKTKKLLDGAIRLADVDHDAVERISAIVLSLRKFARLDAASVDTIDVHQALDDTLILLSHQIKHGVSIVRQYGQVPALECHANQLNQVFMNLLVNAVQSMGGRGTITIRTEVTPGSDGTPGLAVSIGDTGSGIAEADLSRIFDPGFTTKGVGVGTGLGLSIVHQIVHDHHGEVQVKTSPGQGSTFRVELPTKMQHSEQSGGPGAGSNEGPTQEPK